MRKETKNKLANLVGLVFGVTFILQGINRIYVDAKYNTFFIFFGISIVIVYLFFIYQNAKVKKK